jgi:acetolactate synthase-1/2/3 large subunit
MTQESRQLEILRPAVKEVIRIERTERIPELVGRAFRIAAAGRPGPVVVDVPEDIAHDTHPFDADGFASEDEAATIPLYRSRPDGHALERAADVLRHANRPIVLAGGGVHLSGAAETLQAFAEATATPVAHTLSGKGAIACTHALSAGIFGRYSRIANDLIEAADVLLVVGCKLGEIATKRYTLPPPGKTLIHLEIDPHEIGRCYPATVGLCADARAGIEDLRAALDQDAPQLRQEREGWAREVRERMARWREETKAKLESDEVPVAMGRLMGEVRKALPDDGLLIADGGFAAHWGGLLFDTRAPGRTFVPDRGFASIGYGLPGAIGAKLGAPESTVAALTGDGGFNMTLGDLETARRLGLGVAIIVVNNGASGYVKALQHLMYGAGAYQSADLSTTNYARVAEALGCRGIKVERPDHLEAALSEAFATPDVPVVVDVDVTTDPAQMLPGVDSRAAQPKKGDRVA